MGLAALESFRKRALRFLLVLDVFAPAVEPGLGLDLRVANMGHQSLFRRDGPFRLEPDRRFHTKLFVDETWHSQASIVWASNTDPNKKARAGRARSISEDPATVIGPLSTARQPCIAMAWLQAIDASRILTMSVQEPEPLRL